MSFRKDIQSPSSPLEEEVRQEEAEEAQYRDILDRHALGRLRPDRARNLRHTGHLIGGCDALALAYARRLGLNGGCCCRLGREQLLGRCGGLGLLAGVAVGLGWAGAAASGPLLVGRGVVGWGRGLLGLCGSVSV